MKVVVALLLWSCVSAGDEDGLMKLPDDLLTQIVAKLDPQSTARLSMTSRRFQNATWQVMGFYSTIWKMIRVSAAKRLSPHLESFLNFHRQNLLIAGFDRREQEIILRSLYYRPTAIAELVSFLVCDCNFDGRLAVGIAISRHRIDVIETLGSRCPNKVPERDISAIVFDTFLHPSPSAVEMRSALERAFPHWNGRQLDLCLSCLTPRDALYLKNLAHVSILVEHGCDIHRVVANGNSLFSLLGLAALKGSEPLAANVIANGFCKSLRSDDLFAMFVGPLLDIGAPIRSASIARILHRVLPRVRVAGFGHLSRQSGQMQWVRYLLGALRYHPELFDVLERYVPQWIDVTVLRDLSGQTLLGKAHQQIALSTAHHRVYRRLLSGISRLASSAANPWDVFTSGFFAHAINLRNYAVVFDLASLASKKNIIDKALGMTYNGTPLIFHAIAVDASLACSLLSYCRYPAMLLHLQDPWTRRTVFYQMCLKGINVRSSLDLCASREQGRSLPVCSRQVFRNAIVNVSSRAA
ncbi:F-box domain containing protein [Plasmodiophora brassicae]